MNSQPSEAGCAVTQPVGSRGGQALQLHRCSFLMVWEGQPMDCLELQPGEAPDTRHHPFAEAPAPAALVAITECQNPTLVWVGKDLKTHPMHSPDYFRPHLALNTTWTGNLGVQEILKWLQPGKIKSTHKSTLSTWAIQCWCHDNATKASF